MKTHQLSKRFELELGGALDDVVIAYSTYGRLNARRDNVIMVVHALTANSEIHDWWNGLYGPGNVFDPEKYFIICANNLGSPYGTTSAKSINPSTGLRYGLDFPKVTIRDTAQLHIQLLEELGLDHIHLLMGGSCGGNIAQEMAIMAPDRFDHMVLLCCSPQETPWVVAIHESQRIAMNADPTLYQNMDETGRAGLKAARAMALPFYRSHISFKHRQSEDDQSKTDDFKAASYIDYQGEKFIKRFDAHCYYTLLTVLDTHNVARGRSSVQDALSRIKARTLCIGFDTDLLIPEIEQRELADGIHHSEHVCIESLFGHDAFLIESERIGTEVKQFLKSQ